MHSGHQLKVTAPSTVQNTHNKKMNYEGMQLIKIVLKV